MERVTTESEWTSAELYQQAQTRRRENREKLRKRLEEEEADDLLKRMEKCGERLRLMCTTCGKRHDCETRCDIKWCPSCAYRLAVQTVERYRKLCELAEWPLFVTLTTKNYTGASVRPLRKAWGKFRRLRWFRKAAKGGVVAFELTEKGKGYHWHIHALFDCRWLSVSVPEPGRFVNKDAWTARAKAACREVAEQWSLCTERKSSVKVRRVWKRDGGDVTEACCEVLKYAVSSETLLESRKPIAPVLRLMDGTRLVTSFGTFFGKAPKRKKTGAKPCECGGQDYMPEFLVDAMIRRGKEERRKRRR